MKKQKTEAGQRSLHSYFAKVAVPRSPQQPLNEQRPCGGRNPRTLAQAAATADNRQQADCPPPPLAAPVCVALAPTPSADIFHGFDSELASGTACSPTLDHRKEALQQQQQQQLPPTVAAKLNLHGQQADGRGSLPLLPQEEQQQQQNQLQLNPVPEQRHAQQDGEDEGEGAEQLHVTVIANGGSSGSDTAMPGVGGVGDTANSDTLAAPTAETAVAAAAAADHEVTAGFDPIGSGAASAPCANEACTSGTGLTEYELQRLARIRRNQEMMVSMGLGGPGIKHKRPLASQTAKRPTRKRAAASEVGAAPAALRRSTRTRSSAVGSEAGTSGAGAQQNVAELALEPETEPEPELNFDDSSVRRYICEVLSSPAGKSSANDIGDNAATAALGARVCGFCQLAGQLQDPALARAYSVDWRPGLVVAGGKDGVVSVYGSWQLESGQLATDDVAPPLLSRKLHKGWVSDVQFASVGSTHNSDSGSDATASGSGNNGEVPLLLTAGNDGSVCVWDLGRAAEAGGGSPVPQCLVKACGLHDGGIFSLHEQGSRLVTASKDGTVVVSSLGSGTATSLAAAQRYDELHEGVVKCARWQPGGADVSTFASCGNDRRLCVVDARQSPSSGPSLVIEGAHSSAINVLRWHPTANHLLLTASHDPSILLHDLRSPAQPLHRLLGHASAPRIASIYQPCFVAGGAAVATGCERSTLLSLYCTATGVTISRGKTHVSIGATCCGGQQGDPLICTAGRAVYFFRPAWANP